MQTAISDDCCTTWRVIPTGNTVPARVGVCALKVTVPNYPMAGDAQFRTSFQNDVLVNISVGYEYAIEDAQVFLTEARYLGRQNYQGDGEYNAASRHESAENTLIDRRIRDITSEMLGAANIVNFDQAAFEGLLLDRINAALRPRGVQLAALSFVMTPDDQTRQAMDVASARQVYASVGLAELGDDVIIARAGAPRIVVEAQN